MEPKVSEFLYLLGSASQAEEIRIEMVAETLYDGDLLNMVKDLEELLEDRVEVDHHIFVPAGQPNCRFYKILGQILPKSTIYKSTCKILL